MGEQKALKNTQINVSLGPPAPENFNKYITERFGLPKVLSTSNYELIVVNLQKTLTNILGVQLTNACIVHSVNRNEDGDVMFGDMWLELNETWIGDKKNFLRVYRDKLRKENGTLKLKIKVCRLNCKQKMDFSRLPMDILPRRAYCYHIALLYGIPGMHLTLGLKAINGKIFVSAITEETLGKMSFAVGDAILDVERQIVVNIGNTYELIKLFLKSHGIVTCVVERANSESANFYVREAIRTEKGNREKRMNKDVEKICRREKKRMLRESNFQPISILRKSNDGQHSSRRIQYNLKDTVVDISTDNNPKLLQPVPSRNVVPIGTILAPGRSAEAILTENSFKMLSTKTEPDGILNQNSKQSRFLSAPLEPRFKKPVKSITGKTSTTAKSKSLSLEQNLLDAHNYNSSYVEKHKKNHQVVKQKKKACCGTIAVTATITPTLGESESKRLISLKEKLIAKTDPASDIDKDIASAPEKLSTSLIRTRRNVLPFKNVSPNIGKTMEPLQIEPKQIETNTNMATSKSKSDSSSSRKRSEPKK